ncbi:MAG: hypothetical protein ACYC18_06925 [Gammaproteobacteria bacterium]
MTTLRLCKILLTLVVKVPHSVMDRHLPASPEVVGEELARQVHAYVQRQDLGYYPALEFLQKQEAVDSDLLAAADTIAWFVSGAAREEVRRKLRPVFSNVTFQSVQSLAFTLPGVRPGNLNALRDLAEHYALDTVKLTITVSSFQTRDDPEATRKWARHLLWRWLRDSFDSLEVTSAQLI